MYKNLLIAGSILSSSLLFSQASYSLSLTPLSTSSFNNVISNVSDPNAIAAGTLNTTTTDGFNGFFSDNFLAVGGIGTDTISGSFRANNSSAQLANASFFTLDAATIAEGSLSLRFNYIFKGIADPLASAPPSFSLQLVSLATGSPVRNFFSFTATDPGLFTPYAVNQSATGQIGTTDIAALPTGDYVVRVNVNEPTGGGGTDNVVGGFNSFEVFSPSAIPFDFEPSAGIAILGAGFGLNKLRKNLKARKETEI